MPEDTMKVHVGMAMDSGRILVCASKSALMKLIGVSMKNFVLAKENGSPVTVLAGSRKKNNLQIWTVYEDVDVVPMRERGFKKGNKLGRKFTKGFLGYKK